MNHKQLVTVLMIVSAGLIALVGCDNPLNSKSSSSGSEGSPTNWVESFSVDNPGSIRAQNTSNTRIAVFHGEVASDTLVGILPAFESDYRLQQMPEGTTVLQAVRYTELLTSIDDLERVEIASNTLLYVTGDGQYISLSGGVTGDAELYVRNETDRLVEVRRDTASGEVLFAMDAGERRSVFLPSGSIAMFPVAIAPVFAGGNIQSYRSLELSESQNQFQLSADTRVEYTITAQQTGIDVHGYIRVINDYHRGVQMRHGAQTMYTALNELIVNPGSRRYYAFPLDQGEEVMTSGSLQLTAMDTVFELGPVTLQRGYVIDVTLSASGEIVFGSSSVYDPE